MKTFFIVSLWWIVTGHWLDKTQKPIASQRNLPADDTVVSVGSVTMVFKLLNRQSNETSSLVVIRPASDWLGYLDFGTDRGDSGLAGHEAKIWTAKKKKNKKNTGPRSDSEQLNKPKIWQVCSESIFSDFLGAQPTFFSLFFLLPIKKKKRKEKKPIIPRRREEHVFQACEFGPMLKVFYSMDFC